MMRKLHHPIAVFIITVLAVIGIGVGVNASTWQKPIPFSNKLTRFDSQLLSFKYPGSWTAKPYREVGSFIDALVFLSNREMHAPCVSFGNPGGYTCSDPLSRLGYDGVLVEWMANGAPGWTLAYEPGLPILVNGHAARESVVSKHPSCVGDTQQEVGVAFVGPPKTTITR